MSYPGKEMVWEKHLPFGGAIKEKLQCAVGDVLLQRKKYFIRGLGSVIEQTEQLSVWKNYKARLEAGDQELYRSISR